MSLHPSSSVFTLQRAPRRGVHYSSADSQLFTAVALVLAVLVADALLILAAAPSIPDLASLYVTTT